MFILDRSGTIVFLMPLTKERNCRYAAGSAQRVKIFHTAILVEKQAGGRGGGGTRFTSEGKNLLRARDAMQQEFSVFLDFFQEEPQWAVATIKILRRVEMKISARNIWLGTVDHIDSDTVNSVVTVTLKGEDRICSVITLERTFQRTGFPRAIYSPERSGRLFRARSAMR